MKVEYDLVQAEVKYEQEIQLGEYPVRLNFLIIKTEEPNRGIFQEGQTVWIQIARDYRYMTSIRRRDMH